MLNSDNLLSDSGPRAKIAVIVAVIVLALLISGGLYFLFKKDYSPLFSELEPRDAALVVEQLEAMKTEYLVNEQTGEVQVPTEKVHEVRLKLMSSDVSFGGVVGYEIFDNSDFGMTEFAQRINFQRALEGELQRTISALKDVKQARVHLVLPERNLFRDKADIPTASVALILRDNAKLSGNNIRGIQQLVSSSVPNLKPHMVTISDHKGMTLSQSVPDGEAIQMVPWRLRQKMNMEEYMGEKVNRVLAKAFYNEDISVSVDVVLDFRQIKKTEKQMVPVANGKGITRSKVTRLGSDANKPNGAKGNVTREIEYGMGQSVAEVIESPGRLQKINVGIMLASEFSEEERQEIQKLIEVTIGIDKARGDSVAVYSYTPQESMVEKANNSNVGAVESFETTVHSAESVPFVSEIRSESTAKETLLVAQGAALVALLDSKKMSAAFLVAIIVLSITTLLFLILWKRNRVSNSSALTEKEREQVLLQLQHWLSEAR